MENKLTLRLPVNKQERLEAAINSTVNDLYPHNGRVVVTGKNARGETIELGCVSAHAIYQKGANAHALLERVRFGEMAGE